MNWLITILVILLAIIELRSTCKCWSLCCGALKLTKYPSKKVIRLLDQYVKSLSWKFWLPSCIYNCFYTLCIRKKIRAFLINKRVQIYFARTKFSLFDSYKEGSFETSTNMGAFQWLKVKWYIKIGTILYPTKAL